MPFAGIELGFRYCPACGLKRRADLTKFLFNLPRLAEFLRREKVRFTLLDQVAEAVEFAKQESSALTTHSKKIEVALGELAKPWVHKTGTPAYRLLN